MHPLQVMMRTASARPRLCRLWSQREATVVEAAVVADAVAVTMAEVAVDIIVLIGAEEQCR